MLILSYTHLGVFGPVRVNIYVLSELFNVYQLTVLHSHWICGEYQGWIRESLLEHCSPS